MFLGDFKLWVPSYSGFLITTQQLVFIEHNLTIYIILMLLFQLPDKRSAEH